MISDHHGLVLPPEPAALAMPLAMPPALSLGVLLVRIL
jgi:hypothetical protein